MKMLRRLKFLKSLYDSSVKIYGKRLDPDADIDKIMDEDVVSLFPPFVVQALEAGEVFATESEEIRADKSLCGNNKINVVAGDGDYRVSTMTRTRRRRFIWLVSEWRCFYDLGGHALSHILDSELGDISQTESFERVYNKDRWLFKDISNVSEYYAESAWCYIRYNDILKEYAPVTWRWFEREFDKMAYDRMLVNYRVNGKVFPSVRPFVENAMVFPRMLKGSGRINGAKSLIEAHRLKDNLETVVDDSNANDDEDADIIIGDVLTIAGSEDHKNSGTDNNNTSPRKRLNNIISDEREMLEKSLESDIDVPAFIDKLADAAENDRKTERSILEEAVAKNKEMNTVVDNASPTVEAFDEDAEPADFFATTPTNKETGDSEIGNIAVNEECLIYNGENTADSNEEQDSDTKDYQADEIVVTCADQDHNVEDAAKLDASITEEDIDGDATNHSVAEENIATVEDAIIPGTDITMEDIVDATDSKTDTLSFTKLFAKDDLNEVIDETLAVESDSSTNEADNENNAGTASDDKENNADV